MSVAVAHQVSPTSEQALQEGAREARFRSTRLAVIHVAESLDNDIAAATEAGISDAIERALKDSECSDVEWDLHLVAGTPDVAEAVLTKVTDLGPDVLVIGARRRSPVGKAFLGSVAQTIILECEVPVLVVKRGS